MGSLIKDYPLRTVVPALIVMAGLIGLCRAANSPDSSGRQRGGNFYFAVTPGDWAQQGGTTHRNNSPDGANIPTKWDIKTDENIKWRASVGSQTYGNVVVANGKIFVGTNNGAGYLARYPAKIDLGVLLCFRESDGQFLWQHSSEKLPTGRVNDWPLQGVCSTPVAEGKRLWFVSNRGEVICLDAEGFRDGKNDGPYASERPDRPETPWDERHEADVIWKCDMMQELGVHQHNMANCSPTIWGDVLFVCTSNGVDEGHRNLPAPKAPSFLALDKNTGRVLWTDNSPGKNILHGQWSSPAVGVFNDVPQVVFAGGDGWLYSFRADRWNADKPELIWKFDGNPKDSVYLLGGRATRNHVIALPVIHNGLIYLAMGEDPEHGEGGGHLWCINPNRRGDVSPELVVDQQGNVVPHQRVQATAPIAGLQIAVTPNPNSALVWHYDKYDLNGDGKDDFEEAMHRTLSSPTMKDNFLCIVDMSGFVHCLNAKTGQPFWTHDTLDASWSAPLIVDGHIYCGTESGDIKIFDLSPRKNLIGEISMEDAIYTMPVVANNVLYVANRNQLFAISSRPLAK